MIEQVVGTTVSVALRNLIMAVGGVAFLFALAPKLTMGLVLAIPVIRLPDIAFGAEAWALVELEIPAGLAVDSAGQLLQAAVTASL